MQKGGEGDGHLLSQSPVAHYTCERGILMNVFDKIGYWRLR